MSTKAIVLAASAVIAAGSLWYIVARKRAGELPPDCQMVIVTSSGYVKLTLQQLKDHLAVVENPSLSGTPGIEAQIQKLRSCIDRAERWPFP